jgi:hypothetical protein
VHKNPQKKENPTARAKKGFFKAQMLAVLREYERGSGTSTRCIRSSPYVAPRYAASEAMRIAFVLLACACSTGRSLTGRPLVEVIVTRIAANILAVALSVEMHVFYATCTCRARVVAKALATKRGAASLPRTVG